MFANKKKVIFFILKILIAEREIKNYFFIWTGNIILRTEIKSSYLIILYYETTILYPKVL